ncbi:MAG: DUF1583 domain-containing protein, partial [Planctomycetota bacterium]
MLSLCCCLVSDVMAQQGNRIDSREHRNERLHIDRKDDRLALHRIFDDQHVDQASLSVCDHAAKLNESAAFEYLFDWVVPTSHPVSLRVGVDFVAVGHRVPITTQSGSTQDTAERVYLASPAIELIRRAHKMGRIDELQDRIFAKQVESIQAEIQQKALLTLIAITRLVQNAKQSPRQTTSPESTRDGATARKHLDEFYRIVESHKEVFEQVRDAVMLCAAESLHEKELAKLSAEILPSLTERYRTEYVRTAWHRHFYAIAADAQLAASGRDAYQANEDKHLQWHPVSASTARERGSAYPESRWVIEEGSARKLASHHDDFLFFRSPMLGDFDVETHATGFGYRESHVLVGGLWTGLVSNHRQYVFGNVRGELSRVNLDRQLSDTHRHGFIHTRIRSRDSTASTYLNGHPAFEYLKPANADPWLAIRSMYRVSGGVDDFRISGDPVVPETIEMIDSNQLLSWYDYFWVPHLDSNRLGPWTARGFHHLEHEIVSSQSDLLPAGSHAEELLVYTRPMIEDGSIEYEFWYEPNAFDAAPCVAGLAYRLTPRGVLEHRVTHGRYDRSRLRPDNVMPGRLSKQLSKPELDPGHWNRVTLSLVGSTLTISLNDQDVFQTDVDVPANERHFGLFHFADQSSLRVRNARWTGDWPKDTPSLDEQSLVSFEYANVFLNQSALPDRLTHSFDRTSLIDGQFAVVEGDPINDVDSTDDGLRVSRIGRSGYQAAMIGR